MGSRRLLLVPAAPAIVAIAACSSSSTLPKPHVFAVEHVTYERYIADDADRVVQVVGENFSGGLVADAGNPDDSKPEGVVVEIQSQNGGLPIPVLGTLVAGNRFEGTIPSSADDDLIPGLYDLTLKNGDDKSDTLLSAFEMGYRAEVLVLFTATNEEPASGDANRITAQMRMETLEGEPAWRKETIAPLLVVSSGVGAQVEPADSDIEPFDYTQPVFAITDSNSEAVIVTATGIPSDMTVAPLLLGSLFGAGTPKVLYAVPAAEPNMAANSVLTSVRLEDAWGNVCKQHVELEVTLAISICTGATYAPVPVVIGANAGEAPVTINCATTNDAFVEASDVTIPPTNYVLESPTTIMTFD